MLVNLKLGTSEYNRIIFYFGTSLDHLPSYGTAKMKLTILAFLYSGEFLKNPN